jgi:hypothetical protein
MNMPKFTAVAALYQTSGQYRTGRRSDAIHVAARMTEAIHPARDVIEVHGCAPGSYLVEHSDGTWECWSNPDPWWGSDGDGGGSPGAGGEPFGDKPPRGGGGKPPKDKPKKSPKRQFKPTIGGKCKGDGVVDGKIVVIDKGNYEKLPGDIWHCCGRTTLEPNDSSIHCPLCKPEGTPIDEQNCSDGWFLR